MKDGSRLLELMRKSDIEKVRAVSRAKRNGPWVQWWSEMARKTVMRRLSKRLPMSTDLGAAFERDETLAHNGAALIDLQIGRAHVLTPATNATLVCRLLHDKTKPKQ